jgi:hypothetical protein
MSAQIIPFPRTARGVVAPLRQREPFVVRIIRDAEAWLVVCRDHGWLHGDYRAAIADAKEIARGFGVAVQVAR